MEEKEERKKFSRRKGAGGLTESYLIEMTAQDKEGIRAAAAARGMVVAKWIRLMLREAVERERGLAVVKQMGEGFRKPEREEEAK